MIVMDIGSAHLCHEEMRPAVSRGRITPGRRVIKWSPTLIGFSHHCGVPTASRSVMNDLVTGPALPGQSACRQRALRRGALVFRKSAVDRALHLFSPGDIKGSENGVELILAIGTEDRRGHKRACNDEGHGKDGRIELKLTGKIDITLNGRLDFRVLVSVHAIHKILTRAFWDGTAEIFSSHNALGQRRIGQQADLFLHGDFGEASLKCPVQQAIGILYGNNPRQVVFARFCQVTHDTVGRFVRNADMAHLAGPGQLLHRAKRFLYGNAGFVIMLVAISAGPKKLGAPVGPMGLVQVKIICLQIFQATFSGENDLVTGEAAFLIADPVHVRAARHLGGKNDVVAIFTRGHPASDNAFRFPLRFRARWDRVEFSGVEKIETAFNRLVHLQKRSSLVDLVTHHHRPETENRYVEISTAKAAFFHENPRFCCVAAEHRVLFTAKKCLEAAIFASHIPWIVWNDKGVPMTTRKTKIAMLAASSLLSAAAALAPVHAGEFDPAAFPATVEAPVIPDIAHSADHVEKSSVVGQRAALIAVALGALGWLVKLLGPKKVLRAVEKTAQATVKASAAAAKTAARAVRSPLRYLALVGGLILFAMTGIGLYDIEWIGGLVAGAALSGVAVFGAMKGRKALQMKPIPVRRERAPVRKTEQF